MRGPARLLALALAVSLASPHRELPGDAQCQPKSLGAELDVPGANLVQTMVPQTSAECASACCANPKCAGALFVGRSRITWGGCMAQRPCCFMKDSVAYPLPMERAVRTLSGHVELWQMAGRSQDDEVPPEDFSASAAADPAARIADAEESRITAFLAKYRCEHVYLDVGTNIGVQIRKLFEPHLYRTNVKVSKHFEAAFGPAPRCHVCAIGFEPNPRHKARLDAVEERLAAAGFGVLIFRAAAGASDGSLLLQLGVRKSKAQDAGASTLGIGRYGGHSSVLVRQMRLSRIIRHVHRQLGSVRAQQLLSASSRGSASARREARRGARILMKLDVEGSEVAVLPDLMTTRALCALDRVFIEYHDLDFERLEARGRHRTVWAPMT